MTRAQQTAPVGVSAAEMAEFAKGRLIGDPRLLIDGVCHLHRPESGKLCFATTPDVIESDPTTAGALLLAPPGAEGLIGGTAILVDQPRLAFARIVQQFFRPPTSSGIAGSARISDSAKLSPDVAIGEGCVIGPGVSLGPGTRLQHNVVLASGVQIGRDSIIGSNTVIGEVGFGLAKAEDGSNVRIPHLGSVTIGDEVEIGALCSIAGGTIEPTRIRDRARIDDHVFIAHNCDIGEDVMIIACAEVSGGVRVGKGTWIGPNAAIRDSLTIAAGSLIGMGSTVVKSIEEPGVYLGSPARLMRRHGDQES